jgi:protein-S-isoprenylcysteine O-methyltransferase Ste14
MHAGIQAREIMTVFAGKLVWALFIVCWGGIRVRYARRAHRNKPVSKHDEIYEIVLLMLAWVGYLVVPAVYAATPWLSFADYPFQPLLFWIGTAIAVLTLWLFWRSHADLGRNFSAKLVIRQTHTLVTTGVYRLIRHPMYASFLLWSLLQILLLPNWITGLAGLLGFCILYCARIRREEELMLHTFGDQYREYMTHTKRLVPYIL